MNHYQQSFFIEANPAAVYAALTTSEGLHGWWTQDCDVAAEVGEWVGTRLVFRLRADGKEYTRLDSEHIGLVPAFECYELCSDGWRYFLGSLQQFAETGRGTPYELAAAAVK